MSFDALTNPEEREHLLNLPTSFVLPAEDVDRLRKAAGQILSTSPAYQSVVSALGGRPAK